VFVTTITGFFVAVGLRVAVVDPANAVCAALATSLVVAESLLTDTRLRFPSMVSSDAATQPYFRAAFFFWLVEVLH
jgi:Zn-dependent protease